MKLPRLLEMFGMPSSSTTGTEQLISTLSRTEGQLDWITPLSSHLRGGPPQGVVAIGFDTNALKHFRRDPNAASDVLVYLESESIPVIIPGQVSQEFWNNHAAFLTDVEQLVNTLNGVVKKLERVEGGEDPSAKLTNARDQIANVTADFQDNQNPNLMAESLALWEKLLTLATVPFVPREKFAGVARVRFDTKTPPGFADDKKSANQLGDFFVWADFLLGVSKLALPRSPMQRVVFVTDDQKEDWMSFGKPHPILMAELFDISGQVLDIIKPNDFVRQIRTGA